MKSEPSSLKFKSSQNKLSDLDGGGGGGGDEVSLGSFEADWDAGFCFVSWLVGVVVVDDEFGGGGMSCFFFLALFSLVGVMERGVMIWALLEPSRRLRLRIKFVCKRSRVNSFVLVSYIRMHSFVVLGCLLPVNWVYFCVDPLINLEIN